MGVPCGSAGKEAHCNVGDLESIPGLGRSPVEGNSSTYDYFKRGFLGLFVFPRGRRMKGLETEESVGSISQS